MTLQIIQRDDVELTIKELKSQRVQTYLQLLVLEGSIKSLEQKIKTMPKKKAFIDKENDFSTPAN